MKAIEESDLDVLDQHDDLRSRIPHMDREVVLNSFAHACNETRGSSSRHLMEIVEHEGLVLTHEEHILTTPMRHAGIFRNHDH